MIFDALNVFLTNAVISTSGVQFQTIISHKVVLTPGSGQRNPRYAARSHTTVRWNVVTVTSL
ncbi:hypothetical protein D8S78_07350 [Natrialba swarupiae]|nr:hypothetical protein [Natrialba swarupiae]